MIRMQPTHDVGLSETVTVRNGRFRIEREHDPQVRVPDFVLKCVGFVGEVTHSDANGVTGDLHATGFFVCFDCAVKEMGAYVYFVTAKHVAKDLEGRRTYFLVNKHGGGMLAIENPNVLTNRWFEHPTDRTADVVVCQVQGHPEADIMSVHVDQLGIPQKLKTNNIGIGDEVFATGLFTPASGGARIMPILRHGNIAMMPEEQIQTELGYADVYLVEARSIGGLSGSPVFVRPSYSIRFPGTEARTNKPVDVIGAGHGSILLGLMHGHWDIKESEMNNPVFQHDSKRGVNLGVGIVVPAIKIWETLHRTELVEVRQKLDQIAKRESSRMVPGMDSAKPKPTQEERTFTAKDFEEALQKVSRKIDQK